MTPLSDEAWISFTAANMPDEAANEWWVWERMPSYPGIHRYSGCPDGFAEFKALAESASILFDEMDIFPTGNTYQQWVSLLHYIAAIQQLPLLRAKIHPNPRPHISFDLAELEALGDKWHSSPNHQHTVFLVHSAFISSMTLIEAILDPDSVVFTSFAILPSLDEFVGPAESVHDDMSDIQVNFPRNINVFKKISGKSWFIQFVDGNNEPESGILDEQVGFYYIQKMLSSEKQPVSNVDLYAATPDRGMGLFDAAEQLRVPREDEPQEQSQSRRSRSGTGAFDKADAEAITNYRNRRKELLAIIEQPKPNADKQELGDAQKELAFIDKELNSVANLWGKPRQFSIGTPDEVARSRVKKNLSVALASLKKSPKFRKLSEFLKLYLQTQGTQGRQYMKSGEVKWET